MRDSDTNLLVSVLNSLLNFKVVRGKFATEELMVSPGNSVLKLKSVETPAERGGWRFAKPIVYDMDQNYSSEEVVYVTEANAAVTTGHVQPDLTTVYASPGLWVAYKSPQTWLDGADEFRALPHWDNPTEAEILNEDVNPANHIYWIPVWTNVCG